MQIGILEPLDFSPDAQEILRGIGAVALYDGGALEAFLASLDAVFIRLGHRIDAAFLRMAPRLRYVCSPTTGHNHIDEPALAARGITLLSLRGERTFLDTIRATPEHTFGLMLALLRRYAGAFPSTLAGRWDRDSFRGDELFEQAVGIIGLGRVGYRLARYCEAFDAKVHWFDPAPVRSESQWQRHGDLHSLISASRIVVMCANHSAGQAPILGADEISWLAGRYFINTARGELVDESALLEAARKNQLAGLALDVLTGEQGHNNLDTWRKLAPGHNIILTPHIAGATFASMARTEIFIAEKLRQANTIGINA